MKKVLVTGGLGYIGSLLIRNLLSNNYEVVVYDRVMVGGEHILDLLDNPFFTFIKGDIRDYEKLEMILDNSFYAIIHLAAFVSHQLCEQFKKNAIEVNQEASIELFKIAMRKEVERFIFTSTCSNYGKTAGDKFATEEEALFPLSLYAETKVNAEKNMLSLSTNSKIGLTILRFGTIFGLSPRMRFDLLINEIVLNATLKNKIKIYSPNAWRPYLHVQDATRCILTVLDADKEKITQEIFNVVSFNINKKLLIEEIQSILEVKYEIVETGKDNRDYKVSNTKVKQILDYEPIYDLKKGVVQLIQAIESKLISEPLNIKYTNHHSQWVNLDFE